MRIQGIVASGLGHGARFLALPWVQRQLKETFDLVSYPGTLNLRVARAARETLFAARRGFPHIADPASPDCPGYLAPVTLRAGGRTAPNCRLILPEKTIYDDVLEIIASRCLREALAVQDGDTVEVEMAF